MTNLYVLEQVDIFDELTADHLTLIENISDHQIFKEGEVIFEENTVSQEFYIILDGKVAIQVDPDTIGDGSNSHEPSTIAVLRRGQSFGEVAIIDPGVRSASAKCLSEVCKLLVIDRDKFLCLFEDDYKIGYIVMRNFAVDLSLKIRQTNLMIRETLL